MNVEEIWAQWVVHKKNTAEIARKFKLKECDVEQLIAQFINELYLERNKPFSKESA